MVYKKNFGFIYFAILYNKQGPVGHKKFFLFFLKII